MEKDTLNDNSTTTHDDNVVLFAQPYNIDAIGFYFSTLDDYNTRSAQLRDAHGQPVEEFEIQFIDGDIIDMQLFTALDVHQGDLGTFFDACHEWDEIQKVKIIIATGSVGYHFGKDIHDPDDIDIDLYEFDSLRELAMHFIDEGLFGNIPDSLQGYLDYDAIACDLGMDYDEICIGGQSYIYRCP